MNKYNKAATYVNLLLLVELIMLLLVFLVINYVLRSYNADLATILIFAIEIIGNLVYIFALYKLHKLFGKEFVKSIACIAVMILLSIGIFLFEQLLENDTVLLVILLISSVARMLCFYFLLSSFHEVCADMKNEFLARQFRTLRTAYMIGIILNAAAGWDVLGETLSSIFTLSFEIISIYVLIMYFRLRRALQSYVEPAADEQDMLE